MSPAASALAPLDEVTASIAALEEREDAQDQLLSMLRESSPIYEERPAVETERIRARIFSALAEQGAPDASLPFIFEELETGSFALATAAAARALRSCRPVPAAAEPFLYKALRRILLKDEFLSDGSRRGTLESESPRTAAEDVLESVAALAPTTTSMERLEQLLADCRALVSPRFCDRAEALAKRLRLALDAPRPCCRAHEVTRAKSGSSPFPLPDRQTAGLPLEDQDGSKLLFGEFFVLKPSLLAFFYTRCGNPERCSLTVRKLGALQASIAARGLHSKVRVAACTYDPAYDTPRRLKRFGTERGFHFDDDNRFFRTVDPLEPLQAALELEVGFGPSTVNRHRVELFLLNGAGHVERLFSRSLWDEREVLEAVVALERSGR
jgi:protein SCO1/2